MWSWQKSLEFLSGREVSLDDNFPNKNTLSTLFSQDKKHLRKSLSSQELSLVETKVKELAVLRH